MDPLYLYLTTLPVALAAFTLLWLFQRWQGNPAIIDVLWSLSLLTQCAWFAWMLPTDTARAWLLLIVVGLWCLRLAAFVFFTRVLPGHEDQRYTDLANRGGGDPQKALFKAYMFQAIASWMMASVFLVILARPGGIGVIDLIAAALLLGSLVGESLADRQLDAWKKDPANKGLACRNGLWGWSRHPNYFFEWTIWVSLAIWALPSSYGWLGIVPAILMYLVLVYGTGIRLNERQCLKSRRDYPDYQEKVSKFFPLPPKGGD